MENRECLGLNTKNTRLGIICNIKGTGGQKTCDEDAEFDNPETVNAIRDVFVRQGIDTVILEADRNLSRSIADAGITMAFNIAEGRNGRGREAQVPALLDMLGIPYTGSDAVALGVSLDKVMCKRLVSTYGVRTAAYALVKGEDGIPSDLRYPVIVKPNAEGSGKGISEDCVAVDREELEKIVARDAGAYPEGLLVEEYLPGREFTVGIIGNGERRRIYPPMEIIYNKNTQRDFKIYSYSIKCNYKKHVRYECPARLTKAELDSVTESAGRVFDALGCRDVARVDFRMDAGGNFCFLEINPLPGLAPKYSDLPMIAEASGVDYKDLIFGIYQEAVMRLNRGKDERH